MTYKDRFVVAVKCAGKILREKDDTVYLPFGSEYSILLKNLESRKASVKISIDGEDVLEGRSLLINPNSSLELERFVESLDRGNKFKFIQKTKEIVKHRGDSIEDGIIRVEFAFEQLTKHVAVVEDYYPAYKYPPMYRYWYPCYTYVSYNSSGEKSYQTTYSADKNVSSLVTTNMCFLSQSAPFPEEGITVRGSESHQNFQEGNIGTLDPSEVIIIRLKGEGSTGVVIETPITVKDKVKCETCGTTLLYMDNFCSKCGTSIRIK